MELSALQEALPEILAVGAGLVAISPQRREHSRAIAQRRGLTFDLLSDPGNQVAGRFGVVFRLPDELRRLYSGLGVDLDAPEPARFVVDPAGTIAAADADPDYTVRPEPSRTVEVLRRLGAGARWETAVTTEGPWESRFTSRRCGS